MMVRFFTVVLVALLTTTIHAQVPKASYQPLVGDGQFSNFKELQTPSKLVKGGAVDTLQLNGYVFSDGQSNEYMKFFVPPGTVGFTARYAAYKTFETGQAVARLNTPPTTNPALVTQEMAYSAANAGGGQFGGEFNEVVLKNFLTPNKEVYFYGPSESGGMAISYGGEYLTPAPTSGGYLYVWFKHPGGRALSATFTFTVNKACYENWYANAKWDTSNNPDENATHTCSGSTGGGTVTPTDPTPITQATISKAATVTSAANAPVTLEFEVTHPATEVAQAVDYWIAAKVPVGAMFFSQDEWFFAKQSALPTNPVSWSQLVLPNPLFVAYQTTGPIPSAIKTFTLPLGFSKSDLSTLKVQLYFGYRINGGAFINKGMIWDATK